MTVDFLSKPITAGCEIVYPVRRGSSMWLSRLTVNFVQGNTIRGYNPEGRIVTVSSPDRVVVIKEPVKEPVA